MAGPDATRSCDLMVRHGHVLTMGPRRDVFTDGAIAIVDGEIVAVGTDDDVSEAFTPSRVIDAKGAAVHPGYIDGHVHVSHASSRGALSDSAGFEEGMLFYGAWWRELRSSDEYASALGVATELLRSGTTCMVEAGTALEPDNVAEAIRSVGIRGLVADPWLWDVPNLAGSEDRRIKPSLKRSLDLVGTELTRNEGDDLVRGYVALYGIGTSSDELVLAAKEVARSNGALFAQHQSFTPTDAKRDRDRFGVDPLEHYQRLGVLDANTMFVHMNVLSDAEAETVVTTGMGIVACISSAMSWATGGSHIARYDQLHDRQVPIAFGSDSSNSALRWDTSEQGLLALLTARERHRSRDALSPHDVLEVLTIRAATAIGLDHMIGSLEVGKRADIVIRSEDSVLASPRTDVVQNMILTQRASTVDTVVVDGKVVLESKAPVRVDESEVAELVDTSAREMLDRIGMSLRR